MLEFAVSNQTLSRLDATRVVSDSQNYLECAFQFSTDWDGVEAVATFGHIDLAEPISVQVVDGRCRVPHEVIHPYGFHLAVYGRGRGLDGAPAHIPTDAVSVEVISSGAAQGLTAEPTPSLYDSLMAELRQAEESAAASKTSALASASSAAESASAAGASASSAGASASAAGASASSAGASASAAQEAQGVCETARGACETAQAQVQTDAAAAAQALGRLEAAAQEAALAKSYAQGNRDYARLVEMNDIVWDAAGEATPMGIVQLEVGQRYVAEVDGTRYEGVSRAFDPTPKEAVSGLGGAAAPKDEEALDVPTLGGIEDVETPSDPETEETGGGETGETQGSGLDEGETVEPPPAGEDDPPVENPGTYVDGVEVTVGPVTVRSWTEVGLFLDRMDDCSVSTTDTAVKRFVLETDGHDNARYYMEQAKEALRQAQALLA